MPSVIQTEPIVSTESLLEYKGSPTVIEALLPRRIGDALLKHPLLGLEEERALIKRHHLVLKDLNFLQQDEKERAETKGPRSLAQIQILQNTVREQESYLLKHNWKLIHSIAKNFFRYVYHFRNLSERELLFAGAKGFLDGLRNFRLEFQNKLSSFVTPFINGTIRRRINEERKKESMYTMFVI